MTSGGGARRLDRWLWCARLFRTRQAAADFVGEQGVRLMRQGDRHRIDRPGFALKAGDEISFVRGEKLTVIRVKSFSERRGSAAEAGSLLEWINRR